MTAHGIQILFVLRWRLDIHTLLNSRFTEGEGLAVPVFLDGVAHAAMLTDRWKSFAFDLTNR